MEREKDIESRRTKSSSTSTTMGMGKMISSTFAILMPILFPLLHIGIFNYLWGTMNNPVDHKKCKCSCWDTVFKGPYESGIASYKHVYFNGTWNTFKMWTITVLAVICLYECFKKFFLLLYLRKLRYGLAILFLSSLHSHYFAWWGHWNYWNDDFYDMWYHQVFFTTSEIASSILVMSNLDTRKSINPLSILIIANISVFHIVSSGWDQFFNNVLLGKGHLHQVLRDIVLMSTDLIHAGISLYELGIYSKRKGQTKLVTISHKKYAAVIFCTTAAMYLYIQIFP